MQTLTFIMGILLIGAIAVIILFIARRGYEKQIEALNNRLEEQSKSLTQRLEDQARMLQQQSAVEFKSLSEDILRKRQAELVDENTQRLGEMLTPLQNNLSEFRKAVGDFYTTDQQQRAVLNQQIEALKTDNRTIAEEARRLSNSLSANSQVQGRWGETVLETLLTRAGMVKGETFLTQSSAELRDNEMAEISPALRPDVILRLPDEHTVVIDSKVSLTAFLEYFRATDSAHEDLAMRRHVDSVKKHVNELAEKQYHKQIKGAMEHTIMFIPNDSAYIAAVTHDPNLWDYAYRHNVVIVSSTHLLSTLQMITQLWRVEKQNKNADEIAKLGGLIYDKTSAFLKDFETVRTSMEKTLKACETVAAHIEHPSVGLKARAQKLKALGSKTTKNLP